MWPDPETTQALLNRIREGETNAISALLDRHRGVLRAMVQSRLDPAIRTRVDASDIVQDVMLEATQRMADYLHEVKIPFHAWLRQLARDRTIDMYRRHRGSARRSVDREFRHATGRTDQSTISLIDQLQGLELTPAAAAIHQELQAQFLEVLDQLGNEDREVILMRHSEQLSNSQVAELLGLSPAAAGMRYLRALRRLRELLQHLSG